MTATKQILTDATWRTRKKRSQLLIQYLSLLYTKWYHQLCAPSLAAYLHFISCVEHAKSLTIGSYWAPIPQKFLLGFPFLADTRHVLNFRKDLLRGIDKTDCKKQQKA